MIKKRKLYLFIFISLIIFISLTLYILYKPLIRIVPKNPDFEAGSRWVCLDPEIEIVSNETGPLTGYIVINDEKYDLVVSTLGRRMGFYIKHQNDNEEIWLFKGKYKVSKGDIVIKNINYIDISLEVDKIRLHKAE